MIDKKIKELEKKVADLEASLEKSYKFTKQVELERDDARKRIVELELLFKIMNEED